MTRFSVLSCGRHYPHILNRYEWRTNFFLRWKPVWSFYKTNLFKIQVKIKSSPPKKAATTKLKTITAKVYFVVCSLVGQLTRLNSSFTSFRKLPNPIILLFKI